MDYQNTQQNGQNQGQPYQNQNYQGQRYQGQPYQNPPYGQPPYSQQPDKTSVMSMKDWLLTLLLMLIPIANIVFLFIWGFGSEANENKKHWAQAELIMVAIIIGIEILVGVFAFAGIMALAGRIASGSGSFPYAYENNIGGNYGTGYFNGNTYSYEE